MTRTIGFLVYPDFHILDLAGPVAVFEEPMSPRDAERYRLIMLSAEGGLVVSSSGVAIMSEAFAETAFDTLVVVGGAGTLAAENDARVVEFVRTAAQGSRRVASICSGSAILAAAGLVDGRRVTTHWAFATELQRRYPRVRVDAERIFIQDGNVWTSAGVTAGIDLALALLEEDCGREVARDKARGLVVYLRRPGGQSQFSALLDLDASSDRLRRALTYAREHLHEPLTVERLAEIACLSPRQFARAFVAETGHTPAKAIERLRVEAARARLESGSESIEEIAVQVGFADPERMRRAFMRAFGQPPQAIRRSARTAQRES